jgi:hypothetical protein
MTTILNNQGSLKTLKNAIFFIPVKKLILIKKNTGIISFSVLETQKGMSQHVYLNEAAHAPLMFHEVSVVPLPLG